MSTRIVPTARMRSSSPSGAASQTTGPAAASWTSTAGSGGPTSTGTPAARTCGSCGWSAEPALTRAADRSVSHAGQVSWPGATRGEEARKTSRDVTPDT